MTTQNTIQFAGAAEAIDQLIAIAQATRDAYYVTWSNMDFRLWDMAERALSEAVADHLSIVIDNDVPTTPVAWVHRCEQIAAMAGMTEQEINDSFSGHYPTLTVAEECEAINARTNAELVEFILSR
jgi:hypothetical protein